MAWSYDTFKDCELALDLSYKLNNIDHTEDIVIEAEDLNVEKITDVWYFQFFSDEQVINDTCLETVNSKIGLVANFTQYNKCVLDALLKMQIENCALKNDICDECAKDTCYLNSLITAAEIATINGYYQEVKLMIDELKENCMHCDDCPEYGDQLLISGFSIGVKNNIITKV